MRLTKFKTAIYRIRSLSRSQGHSPWCHLKWFHSLNMVAKYEVYLSWFKSYLYAKLKVIESHRHTSQNKLLSNSIKNETKLLPNWFIIFLKLINCRQYSSELTTCEARFVISLSSSTPTLQSPVNQCYWMQSWNTGLKDFYIISRVIHTMYNQNLKFPLFVPRFRKSTGTLNLIRPSVTKTSTLAITFAILQVGLWYLACVFFVTRPFWWYHVVTLMVTFDLLQGQICCWVGDHNFLNLLV